MNSGHNEPVVTKRRILVALTGLAVIIVVAGASALVTRSLTRSSGDQKAPATLHTCSGNDLTAFETHQGAGGSMYVFIIFVNQSKSICTLEGYPNVNLLNSEGSIMPRERQSDLARPPSRRVVLKREGIAGFVLQYGETPMPGVDPATGCRASTQMEVELPHVRQFGETYQAYLAIPLAPCGGGGFSVSAIQEGLPTP